jgi:hypothetical protein
LGRSIIQGTLTLERPTVLLVAIGEPSPRYPAEQGLQLRPTGEMPATVANAANQVGKYGLDDVSGVDLGPQARTESPPDRDPEIRLIRQEDAFDRRDVAFVQPSNPLIQ